MRNGAMIRASLETAPPQFSRAGLLPGFTAIMFVCVFPMMTGCRSPRDAIRAETSQEPEWLAPQMAWVEESLKAHPPVWPPSEERQQALMTLDGALHTIDAPRYPSIHNFYVHRIEEAIREMETIHVTEGVRVWRFYNMGFVVRTPTVTMGFDLRLDWDHEDTGSFADTRSNWSDRLARQLDVLFISHVHLDHMDSVMINRMLELQRPVVAHTGIFKRRQTPLFIRHQPSPLKSVPESDEIHALKDLHLASGATLQYVPYPGHQADLPNTIYLVRTSDGLNVMHTGDLSGALDWAWLDQVKKHYKVDILFVNSWVNDFNRVLEGIKPGIVLTGHEAELGHELIKRKTFFYSHELARISGDAQLNVLCWGESMAFASH